MRQRGENLKRKEKRRRRGHMNGERIPFEWDVNAEEKEEKEKQKERGK